MDNAFGVVSPPRGGVQSVDRALDLLETLGAADQPLGVSDLAARTQLPEGTAHLLLRALVLRGYVRQGPGRKYALGASVLRLRDGARRTLAGEAVPYLTRLVELSGETANLALLEGDLAVYAAQVPSGRALRMFAEVGRRVHPHCTAVGKVLLAERPDEEVLEVLRRVGMPRRTAATIVEPQALLAELARVREQQYAVDDGEEETGVRCLAVPVRDSAGQVLAAVSVSGPAERMLREGLTELAERMRAVVEGMADTVAGSAPSS